MRFGYSPQDLADSQTAIKKGRVLYKALAARVLPRGAGPARPELAPPLRCAPRRRYRQGGAGAQPLCMTQRGLHTATHARA